ncbi:hypothetical protein [Nocardia wallacei]|uniref:TPR repeat region-containing protein n=1 Tax=Nocardia wallacei TaxID=480035 RepID=UPI00245844C3|nr:hypothetical protein [Nocardia wallacei]
MPTRGEAEKWDIGKLSAWAAEIDVAIGAYETQLGRMVAQFNGATWAGTARDAAYNRFSEENTEGRKLSEEIRGVTAALRSAASRLADERRIVLGKVTDAESDKESPLALQVSDRWEVQTKQAFLSGNITREDLQKVKNRVDHHQGLINAAYYSFAGAISEVSTAITTAAEQVRTRGDLIGNSIAAPVVPADTGKLGREDGKAVRDAVYPDGPVDKAVLDEIAGHLPQGVLSEQDLRDLADGKDVSTVPAATQQYYREFYQGAGKEGILALSEHLANQEQAGNSLAAGRRDALANGLMLVSNERIGTGRNPDGTLQSPGSYQQLPEDLRKVVSTRVGGPDGNSRFYPTSPPENELTAQHRFYDDSRRLSSLVGEANPGYEPGTEFSRELTRQAAHLGWARGLGVPGEPGMPDKSATESIMRDYLDISGRNHEAMTQLLTGEDIPGCPSVEAGYNPEKVVQPLLQFDWDDSNGKQPPQLFNWIGENAVPHPATEGHPAVTLEESRLAGHAASGLAAILTSDIDGAKGQIGSFEALMNMPGHDNQSLGQVNPGLTRQLTGAMIPYLDAIGGAPGDPAPDFQLRDGNSEDRDLQAVRMSALFNTDQVSSGAWNAAIISKTNDYAAQYALLSDQPSNDRNQYAEAAGRLMAYQEQGLRAEAFDRGLDDKAAAEDVAGRKKLSIDIAASALSKATGEKFNPLAEIAVDAAGKFISDQVKPEYTGIPEAQQKVLQADLLAQRHYSMLQALSERDLSFFENVPPRAASFPPDWLEDGRLKSYTEIVGPTGTEKNFQATNSFQSTADAWIDGLDIDLSAFREPTIESRYNMSDYTGSLDEYKSVVLKGH